MGKLDYLGEFEHLVLLAVLRLEDEAYGVMVKEDIIARAGRSASFGAIYSTARRLEAKGYLRSRWVKGDQGRDLKILSLTPEGMQALRKSRQRLEAMSEGLHSLLADPIGGRQ